MRFGVNVPIFGEYADVRLLAELAVEAEEAGWDGFWIWDHLQWSGEDDGQPRQPSIDTTVALALIAAETSRVRFGPMVLPLARRRPWKVAREMATLDHLSGGRLTLGVGLGSPPGLEFGDFGEDVDPKVRAGKLDEGLAVLQGLWTGEPFDFAGEHHSVHRAQLLPRPRQEHVPIWVGGEWPDNRAPFRRAARFDGYIRCSSRWRLTASPPLSPIWSVSLSGTARPTGRSTLSSGPRRLATAVLMTFSSCRASLRLGSPGGWNRSPIGVGRSPRCATGSAGAPRSIPIRPRWLLELWRDHPGHRPFLCSVCDHSSGSSGALSPLHDQPTAVLQRWRRLIVGVFRLGAFRCRRSQCR